MANLESINEMDKYTMTLIHKALSKALKKEENQIDPDVGMVRVNAEIRLDVTGEVGRGESQIRTRYPVNWQSEYIDAELKITVILSALDDLGIASQVIDRIREMANEPNRQADFLPHVVEKVEKIKEANKVVKEVKGPIMTEDDLVSLIVPGSDEPTSWDFMETLADDLRV